MIDVDEIKRRFAEACEPDASVGEVRALCEWLVAECDEEAKEVSCGCMGSSPLDSLIQIIAALR